jgi:hypothetical protein
VRRRLAASTRDFYVVAVTVKNSNIVVFKASFNMVFRSALLTASKRMAMVATSQVRAVLLT